MHCGPVWRWPLSPVCLLPCGYGVRPPERRRPESLSSLLLVEQAGSSSGSSLPLPFADERARDASRKRKEERREKVAAFPCPPPHPHPPLRPLLAQCSGSGGPGTVSGSCSDEVVEEEEEDGEQKEEEEEECDEEPELLGVGDGPLLLPLGLPE